jgi:alkanesulfonate monooxygenase SsuD/methylene tetrahydromethanopterin reductase-like flavin-dependent oxidoreductase (luciferase family)
VGWRRGVFDGEFVSFEAVSSNPKPANGTVPIIVGGQSEAAARRAGRIGDGFFPGKAISLPCWPPWVKPPRRLVATRPKSR